MSDTIRWGVFGAGGIAATVSPDIAATEGNVLHAIAARDAGRAQAFADEHGYAKAYGSYADLLADPDVDAVYIATTHGQHHEQALLALNAGKPLLIEKAFTLNAREAREVVALARERGLFCMEAMWTRLHPAIRRALEIARGGEIGEVTGVRADLSRHFPYDPTHRLFDLAAGGGALLDMGIYPTTVTWLFLGRPDTVQVTGALSPTGSDLTVGMQWGYAGGQVGQIFTSAAGPSPFAALVTGTDGWISVQPRIHRATKLVVRRGDEVEEIDVAPDPGNGYRSEIAEAARCLRAGELESPDIPLDETVAILEVLDEARRQLGVRYPADD